MLERHDSHAIVREARDLREALDLLGNEADLPDLILLDLHLPDCSGLEALTAIREAAPCAVAVVVSADDRKKVVLGSLDRGAMGFIPKTMDPDLIWSALGVVLSGGIYLPGNASGCVSEMQGFDRGSGDLVATSDRELRNLGLTGRQFETLRMLVQGRPNKAIARELGISEATVKVYVTAILRAMNVASRTQVVIWLASRGASINDLRSLGAAEPGAVEQETPDAGYRG